MSRSRNSDRSAVAPVACPPRKVLLLWAAGGADSVGASPVVGRSTLHLPRAPASVPKRSSTLHARGGASGAFMPLRGPTIWSGAPRGARAVSGAVARLSRASVVASRGSPTFDRPRPGADAGPPCAAPCRLAAQSRRVSRPRNLPGIAGGAPNHDFNLGGHGMHGPSSRVPPRSRLSREMSGYFRGYRQRFPAGP